MKVEKCPRCGSAPYELLTQDRTGTFVKTRWSYSCEEKAWECNGFGYRYRPIKHYRCSSRFKTIARSKWNLWARCERRNLSKPCGECRWSANRNDGISVLCKCIISPKHGLAMHAERQSCWCWARREARRIKRERTKKITPLPDGTAICPKCFGTMFYEEWNYTCERCGYKIGEGATK